jgi:hypothetical protein
LNPFAAISCRSRACAWSFSRYCPGANCRLYVSTNPWFSKRWDTASGHLRTHLVTVFLLQLRVRDRNGRVGRNAMPVHIARIVRQGSHTTSISAWWERTAYAPTLEAVSCGIAKPTHVPRTRVVRLNFPCGRLHLGLRANPQLSGTGPQCLTECLAVVAGETQYFRSTPMTRP